MASPLARLRKQKQLLEVGSDDLKILTNNKSRVNAIGTDGLNGCTCVVILGKSAIILAHISPYSMTLSPNTGQSLLDQSYKHHENFLAAVTNMMRENMTHFQPSNIAWGIFANDSKHGPMQSVVDQVCKHLDGLSLQVKCSFYRNSSLRVLLPPKGELVGYFVNAQPHLIMESTQLWPPSEKLGHSATARASEPSAYPTGTSEPSNTPSSHAWAGYPTRRTGEREAKLSCVVFGRCVEITATWPQRTNSFPMVWIQNGWVQTQRSDDGTLVVRDNKGAEIRLERPPQG